MIYVLAVIGVIAIIAVLWRTFDAQGRAIAAARRDRAMVPPDDDPDFLRRLGEQQHKPNEDGDSGDG